MGVSHVRNTSLQVVLDDTVSLKGVFRFRGIKQISLVLAMDSTTYIYYETFKNVVII